MNKTQTLKASRPEDLTRIAKVILDNFKNERVFALYGKMGAGKTTLVKAFTEAMGSSDVASSPTFSLVNQYNDLQGLPFYHFDFYRINKIEEVFDIGFEEYIYSGNYCFLEWPELISQLLPESYVYISIEVNEDEERLVTFYVKHHQEVEN
ncbi:MAG: tRNA (adenosine(37)-N6)-threonylcarbamoyltransferase complex ATPase subunit type 1 TsaE [Bacteroidales bacterium]|nr:tRNA (adenosine(37)-N6)-threonylcarbamoyltransferase complex ATPase subunit type 1 TsaE [Bacteroidales bacterium]